MSLELTPIMEALGWTLLHSLWQGAIIAFVLFVLLKQLKSYESSLRYFISLLAMGLVILWSGITFQSYLAVSLESEISFKEGIPNILIAPLENPTMITNQLFQNVESKINNTFESYLPWFVVFWVLGIAVFTIRNGMGLFEVYRLKTSGKPDIDQHYIQLVEVLGKKLGISKTVQLLESSKVRTPMVIGFIKPVILFPVGLVSGLTTHQIEAVLLHELAHIKRQDYMINLIQTILDSLFFFNPAFWFISNRIREERENCCDDIALEFESDPIEYARALTILGGLSPINNDLVLGAGSGKLYSRIKRMFNPTKRTTMKDRMITMTLLTLALVCLVIYSVKNYSQIKDQLLNPGTQKIVEVYESEPLRAELPSDLLKSSIISKIIEPAEIQSPVQDDKKKKEKGDSKQQLKKELKEKEEKIRELEQKLVELESEKQKERAEEQRIHAEVQRAIAEKHRELSEIEREIERAQREGHDEDLSEKIEAYQRLSENLHDLSLDTHIDIDIPEITVEVMSKTMDELKIELKEVIEIEDALLAIDAQKIKEAIRLNEEEIQRELEQAMKTIKINEEEMKASLKEAEAHIKRVGEKFERFEAQVKKEMVKDNIIDSVDDDIDFHFKNDQIYINGEKLSPELNDKYIDLWENFFEETDFEIDIH